MSKLKAAMKAAEEILAKYNTVEKATALTGAERAKYLAALDTLHGNQEARAKAMGFGDKTWYHGTSVPVDEFKNEAKGLSTGAQSAKKGFFFAEDPSTASDYANLAQEKGVIREGDKVTTRWMSDTPEPEKLGYNHYKDAENALWDVQSRVQQETKRKESLQSWLKAKAENAEWLVKSAERNGKTVDEFIAEKTARIQQPIAPASKKEIESAKKAYQQALTDFAKTNDPDYADKIFKIDLENAKGDKREAILNAMKSGRDYNTSGGQNVLSVRLKGDKSNIHVKDYEGQGYRDTTYANEMAEAEKSGKTGVLFKNTFDPADPNNRVEQNIAAVFNPEQIRSTNAAFDPRFANSAKIAAGVAAVPTTTISPLASIKSAADWYHENVSNPLKKTFVNQMDLTPDKSMKNDPLMNIASEAANPTNYLPGAGGALIQGLEAGSEFMPKYADGGEVAPAWEDTLPIETPMMPVQSQSLNSDAPPAFEDTFDPEERYGSFGQQALTAVEGVAEGIAGPLAPLIETKVLGVKPQDILARREENPITHGLGQATGLGASLFAGTGVGSAMTKVGGAAAKGIEGATIASKIGKEAVDQAAQAAFFQGSDEASKMILNDPEQTAQSAIANIGLSAAMGGATGAAIGSISPLWKASGAQNAIAKPIEDMKARWKFRQENPNIVEAAGKELQDLHTNIDQAKTSLYSEVGGGIRGESIAGAMPEVLEKNTIKINNHIQEVSDTLSSNIEKMASNVKTKSGAKLLEQDLKDFQTAVTDPAATYVTKFNAVDDLKRTLQKYSKYGMTAEDSAFGEMTKKLAAELRPALENAEIWGKAASVQKDINAAISKFIPVEKDIMSMLTSKVAGDKIIDPGKISTYMNQLGKSSAEIKQIKMKNYLDQSEELINTVNKALTDRGLEPAFAHTSTNVLSDSIGKRTMGSKLIDKLIDKELDKIAGKAAGGATGGALGSLVGHPFIGFLAGEHALGPVFSSVMSGLTKAMTENPTLSKGFKSAFDLSMAAAKGQKTMNTAAANVFKVGMPVLASHLIPDTKSRDKLDKVVTQMQDFPEKLTKLDHGAIGHYLPNHQLYLSQTATTAIGYLQDLKPKPHIIGPLDKPIPPQPAEVARYNRALDIAQQPAIVLQHIKNGTLQASDIQDLNAMYPGLYRSMSQKLSDDMMRRHSDEESIPYKTRIGISLFLGQPIDRSMMPSSIMAAQPKPAQQPQPQQQQTQGKSMKSLGKSNKDSRTPDQAAQAAKSNRD